MHYSAPLSEPSRQPSPPFRWLKRLLAGIAVAIVVIGCVVSAARYVVLVIARKRTEQVIVHLDQVDPGWRFEQIQAGRRVLPKAENSALTALAVRRLLPPDWPTIRPKVPLNGQAPMEEDQDPPIDPAIVTLFETATVPPLDTQQIDSLRVRLAALMPAITEARKIADMPHGRYAVAWALNPLETRLPHAQEARGTARLLKLDAILRAHDGDADGALASSRAELNVGRSLGDEPLLMTQLVRIAIESPSLRTIEHVLANGEPSDGALSAVQGLLEDEEAQPLFRFAVRGERAALNDLYARLASGQLNGFVKDGETSALDQWLYRQAMCIYARGIILEEMTEAVAIADAPLSQQYELAEAWAQELGLRSSQGTLEKFSRLLLPAISPFIRSYVTSRTRLRTAIVAVAAERFRRKHGRWPESVGQLTPWPLSRVPTDPHTDGPLIWSSSEETLVIYSPGPDLVDDGGALEQDPQFSPAEASSPPRKKPYWEDKDIGFRLWDVTRRRQPPLPKPRPSEVDLPTGAVPLRSPVTNDPPPDPHLSRHFPVKDRAPCPERGHPEVNFETPRPLPLR